MKTVAKLAPLALMLTLAVGIQAQALKPGLAKDVVIDGKLDEAAWSAATPDGPFGWLKNAAKPGDPAQTEFRILADADAFYVGIRCDEPEMAKLKANPISRDGDVFSQDVVEVFFDPQGKGVNFYQFAVSAAGDQWDQYYIEKGNTTIGEYNGVWASAVFKGDTFWSVEMRVPLRALYHSAAVVFAPDWKFNVARERKPEPQLTTWSPLVKGFLQPDHFRQAGPMPRKLAKYDLAVTFVEASIQEKTEAGYAGTLFVKMAAKPHAYGDYRVSVIDEKGGKIAVDRKISLTQDEMRFPLADAVFPALGKTTLRATVTSSTGEVVADMYCVLRASYAPIAVTLTEPFYANCVFPGQALKAVAGVIVASFPPERLKGAAAALTLCGPDGKPVASATCPLANGEGTFSMPVGNLADGDYSLACAVSAGGQTLADSTTVLRKLPPSPGSCVWIDRDLNLVVDGEALYVRGWYGGPGYLVSKAINDRFNNQYGGAFIQQGGQVGLEAERIDPSEGMRIKTDVEPSRKVFDEMRLRIEKARTDKGLWWYYLCDEPECRGVSPVYLKHMYDFVKKLDPYHPVMIITRAPEKYTECADILNPHPYPNPVIDADGRRSMSSSLKEIPRQIRTVLAAGKNRIPPWLTPQAFSYEFQDPCAQNPTFDEYTCMLFSAVAAGCKGFTPFMYCAHFNSLDLRVGNEYIYETLARIEPFLLSGETPLEANVTAEDDGVIVWIKRVDGKVLVIAVNLLDRPLAATVACPALAGVGHLVGFREKGETAVTKEGGFTLNFAPYQVHMQSTAKLDDGLKPVEEVKAELTAAIAALRKPGNVLYGKGREIEYNSSDAYTGTKLYTLVDGILDAYGWTSWTTQVSPGKPGFIELSFPTFTPAFTKVQVHTATIEDMEFLIWKRGEWKKMGEVTGNDASVIVFDLPEKTTTVKVRFVVSKVKPGTRAEVYEIEMFE
jgi:hypothetical protein